MKVGRQLGVNWVPGSLELNTGGGPVSAGRENMPPDKAMVGDLVGGGGGQSFGEGESASGEEVGLLRLVRVEQAHRETALDDRDGVVLGADGGLQFVDRSLPDGDRLGVLSCEGEAERQVSAGIRVEERVAGAGWDEVADLAGTPSERNGRGWITRDGERDRGFLHAHQEHGIVLAESCGEQAGGLDRGLGFKRGESLTFGGTHLRGERTDVRGMIRTQEVLLESEESAECFGAACSNRRADGATIGHRDERDVASKRFDEGGAILLPSVSERAGERRAGREVGERGGVGPCGGQLRVIGRQEREIEAQGLFECFAGVDNVALCGMDATEQGVHGGAGEHGLGGGIVANSAEGRAGLLRSARRVAPGVKDASEECAADRGGKRVLPEDAQPHAERVHGHRFGFGKPFADEEHAGERVHGVGDLGVLAAMIHAEADEPVAEGHLGVGDEPSGLASKARVDLAPESAHGLIDASVVGEGACLEAVVQATEPIADDIREFRSRGIGVGKGVAEKFGDGAGPDGFGASLLAFSCGVREAQRHHKARDQHDRRSDGAPREACTIHKDGLAQQVPARPAAGIHGVTSEEALEVAGERCRGLVAEFALLAKRAEDDGFEVGRKRGDASAWGHRRSFKDGLGDLEEGALHVVGHGAADETIEEDPEGVDIGEGVDAVGLAGGLFG